MLDDAGIVGGKGLRKFIFLALLQEEKVQGLLDRLLALDGQQLLRLGRIGRDPRRVLSGGCLQVVVLGVQSDNLIVDGLVDGTPHGGKGLVHVPDQHVLLTGVGDQVVPLKQLSVVLADLGLDAGVVDAHVRRKRQIPVSFVGQIVLDVPSHLELVVQSLHLLVKHRALAHIHTGGHRDVRQQVGGFVGGNVAVHPGQLGLDDPQAVRDEDGSGVRDLVLILDPEFVVNADQGTQNVGGALGGDIVDRQVDYLGILIAQVYLQRAQKPPAGRTFAGLDDIYLLPEAFLRIIHSLGEYDAADRTRQGVAQGTGQGFGIQLLVFQHEIPHLKDAVNHLHRKGGRALVIHVQEFRRDGQGCSVQEDRMEKSGFGIRHIELQTLHHLRHQVGGLEGANFVLHPRINREHTQVAEVSDLIRDRLPLGVRFDLDLRHRVVLRRRLENIIAGEQQSDRQRQDKPGPF